MISEHIRGRWVEARLIDLIGTRVNPDYLLKMG
jgi:hypothetical protein